MIFSEEKDNSDSTSPDDYNSLTVDDDYELSEEQLIQLASNIANYGHNCIASGKNDPETHELNNTLIQYELDNCQRDKNGRVIMPLFWNSRVAHLLGDNYNISKNILLSILRKHGKNSELIHLIDKTFKVQEAAGIIKHLDNLEQFRLEYPSQSFLPFMSVLRPEKETTKCCGVFLSNLCGKVPGKTTLSHIQVINPGPSLNPKLCTALINLRFGNYIICFDLKKAFNMIDLSEMDQSRLLFLWFRNVERQDYTIVGYKNCRLSFGLRCSPTILMLTFFKLLVVDAQQDPSDIKHLKSLIYHLSYMNNC